MFRPLPLYAAVLTTLLALPISTAAEDGPSRPNILWITCEDISPHLGCYHDPDAATPRLDRFAAESLVYTRAFATIGVCAPARSTLITGLYPPSLGTHPMRCQGTLPRDVHCFPVYLRAAGYYCTNNVKTDYNFTGPDDVWDESSRQAHWRNRSPGQPFFSVVNFTTTHESRIRQSDASFREVTAQLPTSQRHDPAAVHLPPYHPDTPEVRRDWARYHDLISVLDAEVGDVLDELEADGLADDTIVFFYSDHGAGLPRSKRWLYDTSVQVPLLVRIPPRWRQHADAEPPGRIERLVSFVDFAPTVLSLASIEPPRAMQGHAFLGPHAAEPRQYVHGFRDRMDERTDLLRSVRDHRFKYIRNYYPQRPWFHEQYVSYMYEMPTMQIWQRWSDEGRLWGPAAYFMSHQKPPEELYDTQADPWELNNLADDPRYAAVRDVMRGELRRWMLDVVDLGFLPEADLRSRFGDTAPYASVRAGVDTYPLERTLETAEWAAGPLASSTHVEHLIERLGDDDPAVRYWAATGLGRVRDDEQTHSALRAALTDEAVTVRLAAAEALCTSAIDEVALAVLVAGLGHENPWARLQAAEALDRRAAAVPQARAALATAQDDDNQYVVRVVRHALGEPAP